MTSMHQRRRRALATTAAGALALTALAGSPAAAEEGPEQLQNGSFSNSGDPSPWYAYGVASRGVVNGEYCVTTNAGAGDSWIAAIGVNDVPIVAGETYAFTFKARASTGVTINANVQKGEPDWNQALGATPGITTEQQTFRYTFTAGFETAKGQVAFQIGGKGAPALRRRHLPARGRGAGRLQAGHRLARPRQPGRLPAQRPEARHPRDRQDRRRRVGTQAR